jgi:hypothetical protein
MHGKPPAAIDRITRRQTVKAAQVGSIAFSARETQFLHAQTGYSSIEVTTMATLTHERDGDITRRAADRNPADCSLAYGGGADSRWPANQTEDPRGHTTS